MSGPPYGRPVSDTRTFIVRVSEAPRRVVIEDVRARRRTVAGDLASVGAQIAVWLEAPASSPRLEQNEAPCEESVSHAGYGRRLGRGKP